MELLDKDTREKLEKDWGPVAAVDCGGGQVFAFRCPAQSDMAIYHSRVQKEDADAGERMLRACCVYPSREEFAAYLEEFPLADVSLFRILKKAYGDSAEDATADDGSDVIVTSSSGVASQKALRFGSQVIGIRKPDRATSKMFQATMKESRGKALEALAAAVVIYSEPVPYSEWIKGNPFAAEAIADAAVVLAGFGGQTVGK